MKITDLHADIMALPRTPGSEHFIETCAKARSEISRLLDACDYAEAAVLSGALCKVFDSIGWKGAAVMAEIIPLFPVNRACTLRHLGQDDVVDRLIFATKLELDQLSSFDGDAWLHVLRWARERRDLALCERLIVAIANDIHGNGPNNTEHLGNVSLKIIRAVAPNDAEPLALGETIDQTIASIIAFNCDNNVNSFDNEMSAGHMPAVAQHGLKKTLMRMLEKNVFATYLPDRFSSVQNEAVYGALPDNPSPAETFWIQRKIAKPGVNERILFDPQFDIEAYIEVLRPPYGRNSSYLSFSMLKTFRPLLTLEDLTTPDRKRRAGLLINAVVDHQMKVGRYTLDQLREKMSKCGLDPYVLKMTRVLKGVILEEELGL